MLSDPDQDHNLLKQLHTCIIMKSSFLDVYAISPTAPAPRFNLRTESGMPPSKPPSKPGSGNYCLRASTEITVNGEKVYDIIGYSEDVNIAQEVTEFCERKVDNMSQVGECMATRLFFLGPRRNCHGIRCNLSDSSTSS